MRVGIAYPAFFDSFQQFYSKLETIKSPEYVANYDLIIFSGGNDINPNIYDNRNYYAYAVDDRRDNIEMRILSEALSLGKQILGVCRGHQLINAILGGFLYQDIYLCTKKPHIHKDNPLEFSDDSILKKFFTRVNSMHHQAVKVPGNRMKATAWMDEIIEGTESPDKRIITTQFHPEFMSGSQPFFNYLMELAERKPKDVEKINIKETRKKITPTLSYEDFANSFTRITPIPSNWAPTDRDNSEQT